MNKKEFLDSLKQELEKNKIANINEVLSDYEEHFTHGLEQRKSEEAISAKLGSPHIIAKAYETERMIEQVKTPQAKFQWSVALKVIGRLMIVAPFNFLVLLIPGIIIFSFLAAGWSVIFGLAAAAIALLSVLFTTGAFTFSFWLVCAAFFSGLGVLGISALVAIVMFYLTKLILLGLINYLQWNLKFVKDV